MGWERDGEEAYGIVVLYLVENVFESSCLDFPPHFYFNSDLFIRLSILKPSKVQHRLSHMFSVKIRSFK